METATKTEEKPRVSEKQRRWKAYNARVDCGFQPTDADLEAIQCIYDDAAADADNPAGAGAYQLWIRYRGVGKEQSQSIKAIAQFAPGMMMVTLVKTANQRQEDKTQYYAYANSDWYCTTQTMWYTSNLHWGAKGNLKCQKIRDIVWDIDNHTHKPNGVTPEQLADEIDMKIRQGVLPQLVVIVTGRGVQLHMPIEPVNPNNLDVQTAFCAVYNEVSRLIKDEIMCWHSELQLDKTVDNARLHRIPGTYNTGAHAYAHADYRHASIERKNIQVIAQSLGVHSCYKDTKPTDAEVEAAKLAKAMAIMAAVSDKTNQKTRYQKALNLAQHLQQPKGKRHNVLLALSSTMLDNGGTVDAARVWAINKTFPEPLPQKDVDDIVKLLNKPDMRPKYKGQHHKPMHQDTIFKLCGVEGWYSDGKGDKPKPPDDVLDPPAPGRIYSKREVYWAIGYLKQQKIITDDDVDDDGKKKDRRTPNKTRDKQRAIRKGEKTRLKEKARQLVAGGLSVRQAAEEVQLSPTTISNYIKEWETKNE